MGKKKGARPRVFNDNLDPVPSRPGQPGVGRRHLSGEREDKPLVLKRPDTAASSNSERNVKGRTSRVGRRRETCPVPSVPTRLLWELSELSREQRYPGRSAGTIRKGGQAPQAHRCRNGSCSKKAVFIYELVTGQPNRNLNTINRNWSVPHRTAKMEHAQKRVAQQAWPDHPEPETVRRHRPPVTTSTTSETPT